MLLNFHYLFYYYFHVLQQIQKYSFDFGLSCKIGYHCGYSNYRSVIISLLSRSNLSSLSYLDLYGNQLTGVVPASLCQLYLTYLYFRDNQLECYPECLSSRVQYLDVGSTPICEQANPTPPSYQPSCQPSLQPSQQPSSQPSDQPSFQPSLQPSTKMHPSSQPSMQLSQLSSSQPSEQPSCQPSSRPSVPSVNPSIEGKL